jgi:hypothetical protein
MRISDNLQQNFPFITVLGYVEHEYVGIIINQDSQVTSMYDYSALKTEEEKTRFLEMGDIWWWESNRMIPINIFLNKEMHSFKYIIKNLSSKDVKVLFGPVTSLNDIIVKRVKRRSITLVRRTKD